MKEYTEALKEHLGAKRYFTKTMFKVAGTIYRGVNNNRFTAKEGLDALNKL